MSTQTTSKARKTGNRLLLYLGGAWLLVEVFNFLIERYNFEPLLIDFLILAAIFGLLATVIYSLFNGRYNKVAIGLQAVNIIAALSILFYFLAHPLAFDPNKLRVLKLTDGKSSALGSLNSVAVLPFYNLLGDESQDYLLAGMHDGLVTEIGRLGSIRVTSTTSSLQYKNSNKNLKQIAKELDVDAFIETSLTRVDSVIEMKVKLIDVFPDEDLLWDHSYSTSLGDLPNLYKEVTKNVALKINDVLSASEEEKLKPVRPVDPRAYAAFLRGKYYNGHLTHEGFERARVQFEKSIKIDSLHAPSYAGLSGVLGAAKQMGYVSGQTVDPIIDSLQAIAFEIDSLNAILFMGRAGILTWTKFEWEEAERYFKQSLELDPNEAMTRSWYAHYLMIQNRWEEAWDQMNYATELDPDDPWVVAFNALMYYLDGKLLSAAKHSERLVRIAPDHPMANEMLLGKYVALNKPELAVKELKKYVSRTGAPGLDDVISRGYENGGFTSAVKSAAEFLEKYSKKDFVSPRIVYVLYEILKDKDKRLEWMYKMYEVRDPNLPYFAIRNSDPIQNEATYKLIMKEIGLW